MFLSNDPPDGGTHMTELEKKKKEQLSPNDRTGLLHSMSYQT